VRLEENYRSTPQVLELANRLVPRLGGAEKVLRATRDDGPEPELRPFVSAEAEDAWLAAELRALAATGISFDNVAILCRTNARLADFEEVLHDAGVPFQGSSLLTRDAARRALRALERDDSIGVRQRVRELALDAGWLEVLPEKLGERELTRQTDLARLVKLAAELDDGELTCTAFAAELRRRFDPGGEGARGVHLLTYHRAKGLEFEAVFLPRLEDKELPSRLARTPDEQAEERRLLYVGITRAKRRLAVTWSRRPSPFLAELRVLGTQQSEPATRTGRAPRNDSPEATRLRRWRLERARADSVPPYVIFPDRTIDELLAQRPTSIEGLAAIHGLGAARLGRFGEELLAVLEQVIAHGDTSASGSDAVQADARTMPAPAPPPVSAPPAMPPTRSEDDPGLYEALATWRRRRASGDGVPAYHVFANRTLAAIAEARPRAPEELLALPGVGPAKLERYGDEVLEVVADLLAGLPAVA
jgi:DNA helicase-2/ATP-dependent DNA helicase PcrA